MTDLHALLLSLVLGWQPPATPRGHAPEPRPVYESRIATQVDAAWSVTHDPRKLAALFVVDRQEGGMDPWVHAGLVHPNPHFHQDHGRARCPLQIRENKHIGHDGWLGLAGHDFEATRRCFAEGLRLLNSAAWLCTGGQMLTRDDMARVFAAYGRGHGCTPTAWSMARANMWDGLRRRLGA